MKNKIVLTTLFVFILSLACSCTVNVPAADVSVETPIQSEEEKAQEEKTLAEEEQFKKNWIGSEVADFKMKNFAGELISLADLKGENYCLFFSRTDCPYCDDILPQIMALGEKNLKVISVFRRDTIEDVESHYHELGYEIGPYVLAGMSDEENNNVMELFELVSVPTVMFVNTEGVVSAIEIGFEDDSDLVKKAQALMFIK